MKENIELLLNKVSIRMKNMKNNGMKEKFPVSLIDMDCWEWPQGVGLYGLYRYYALTKDEETLDFLIKWFDGHLEKNDVSERNVNTTAPMLTLTYLYEKTGKESYRKYIEDWVDWIMEGGLIRTGDGCFQHMITGDANTGEILIDTLFMTVLFLGRAGRILNRPDCTAEADYQILNHIKYLLNREESLFYHGWNFTENHNYGKVMWGRGNCWYTLGIMEYLEEAELEDSLKRYYLTVFENQVKALTRYQDQENGLWHTVLNNPDTYVEISASAAFLAGMMKGIRTGYLEEKDYLDVIQRGLKGILEFISEDGTVLGVSYGTPIGWNEEFYGQIACCPMTYGQALMLVLLQEVLEGYWNEKQDFLRGI